MNIKIFKRIILTYSDVKFVLMEDEIDKNDEITEYIGLSSKCCSYITKNN